MPLAETVRLWGLNLAIAATLILGMAWYAALLFRSLPKQHAALLVGIVASLFAPLLVLFAWAFGLGQLPGAAMEAAQRSLPKQNQVIVENATVVWRQEPVMADVELSPIVESAAIHEEPASSAVPKQAAVAMEEVPSASRPDNNNLQQQAALATPMSVHGRAFTLMTCGLLAIWSLGSSIVCLRCVQDYLRCQRLLKQCQDEPTTVVRQALSYAANQIGMQEEVRLLCASGLPAPAVVGIWRPTVLVPHDTDKLFSPTQLHSVLVHELSHIARNDHWMMGLTNIALVLYWWNPLLHAIVRRISETREMICDDIASAASDFSDEYAAAIVSVAERAVHHAGTLGSLGIGESSTTELEKRLRRILTRGNRAAEVCLSPLAKYGMALFVVVLCGAAVVAQVPERSTATPTIPIDIAAESLVANATQKQAADKDAAQAEKMLVVRGKVVSEEGKGIANAQVVLPVMTQPDVVLETRTDSEGNYELKTLISGNEPQKLRAIWAYSKDFCLGAANPYRQVFEESIEPLQIVLPKLKTIPFQVLSPTGKPVHDAKVHLLLYRTPVGIDVFVPSTIRQHFTARTDADGRVTLVGLEPEKMYTTHVDSRLYGTQSMTLFVDQHSLLGASQLASCFQLRDVGSIEGKLIGDPEHVRNVTVFVKTERSEQLVETEGQAEVQTDAEGRFHVPAIANGLAEVSVKLDTSGPVFPDIPNTRLRVQPGRPTSVVIKLKPKVKVHGLVRGKNSHRPIPHVEISFRRGKQSYETVTTDEQGKYEADVISGAIEYRVESPKVPGYLKYTSHSGDQTWSDFIPTSNAEGYELHTIELLESQEIRGHLVDKQNKPLANKSLTAKSGRFRVGDCMTGKDGSFILELPEQSTLDNTDFVTYEKYSELTNVKIAQRAPLVLQRIDSSDEGESNREKRSEVTLVGRLMLGNQPATGITINLSVKLPSKTKGMWPEDCRVIGTFESDAKGCFRLKGLKTGDHYHLAIARPHPTTPIFWQQVNSSNPIPHTAQGELNIPDIAVIPMTQSISGIVVNANGEPNAGVHVAIQARKSGYLFQTLLNPAPQVRRGSSNRSNSGEFPETIFESVPWVETNAKGEFRFDNLPDIPLEVKASIYYPHYFKWINPTLQTIEKNQQDIRLVLDPRIESMEE